MDHPFRNATFGGFNRQDVLTYLENTAKQSAAQLQQLQEQLDQATAAAQEQGSRRSEQEQRLTVLQQDNDSLRAQLEQANIALSASRTQCSQTQNELATAYREAEQLRQKVADLEPDAGAYAAIKERTAGVELDAHRRAQAVQQESEQQAKQLRRQMEAWLARVEREYDALRTQVETTVSHAADQLDKAEQCLEQVGVLMNRQEIDLEALAQAYADTDPAKVAAPMPIPEG